MSTAGRVAWMAYACAGWALALAPSVRAQSRSRDSSQPTVLQVRLLRPAVFGNFTVPARRYRISVDGEHLTLTDASTMVVRATVPVTESRGETVVDRPTVQLRQMGRRVQIIVKHLDRIYTAVGTDAPEPTTPPGSEVSLAAKKEAFVSKANEGPSELSLIRDALKRYLEVLLPCAERVRKNGFQTDDPRFEKCVCPWTEKWRLPPVQRDRRVHQALVDGRAGFSFTVTARGRVADCRVWVGKSPPQTETASGPSAPAGVQPGAAAKEPSGNRAPVFPAPPLPTGP